MMYLLPHQDPTFAYDSQGFKALKNYIGRLEQYDLPSQRSPMAPGYEFSLRLLPLDFPPLRNADLSLLSLLVGAPFVSAFSNL